MPLTIKRNRFPANLDLAQQQSRFVERVIVEGTTITPGSEQEVLFSVYADAAFPKLGEALTGHAEFLLRRVVFDSVGYDIAGALLFWEQDGFGGTPSVSVLTESTLLTTYTTNLLPGTRLAIKTGAIGSIPADTVTFSLQAPHRQVSINQLMTGDLPDDLSSKVFHVNSAEWRGLPKGYWLVSEYTTSVSKYTNYYQRKIAAISRVIMDWSEGGLVRGPDGVIPTAAFTNLEGLMDDEYSYGTHATAGAVRVDPYPQTDFDEIFTDF